MVDETTFRLERFESDARVRSRAETLPPYEEEYRIDELTVGKRAKRARRPLAQYDDDPGRILSAVSGDAVSVVDVV